MANTTPLTYRIDTNLKSYPAPVAIGALSPEELNTEQMKGYNSIKHEKKYSSDEVDDIFAKEFGT